MGDQIIMFISQIFNGLKIGSVYSLVALGYTMVYGIIRLINFAHGDFIMVGSYVLMLTIPAIVAFGLPAWVAVIPAILMCVAVGVIVERAAYKPVREKGNSMTALITAIAMSLLLENGSQAIFGADYQTVPTIIQIPTLAIGKLKIDGATIITIVLGVIIMVALQLFVTYTKQGKAMRAVSEDTLTAESQRCSIHLRLPRPPCSDKVGACYTAPDLYGTGALYLQRCVRPCVLFAELRRNLFRYLQDPTSTQTPQCQRC